MNFRHVLAALTEQAWAMTEDSLRALIGVVELRVRGDRLSADEIQARTAGGPGRGGPQRVGPVAVLPVYGPLTQRMNLLADVSGGTSSDVLASWVREATRDPAVEAIVLDVDSPGGGVYGLEELAAEVARARTVKPTIAVANSLMASAAYWVGSQANEVVVAPGGDVGSIGIFAVHTDLSKAFEKDGITHTIVSAGRFKAEGHPSMPLAPAARQALQDRIDRTYGAFVRAVAAGRGVPEARVRSGFGEGRIVNAEAAVREGMADRVGTLRQTIERVSSRAGQQGVRRQESSLAALSREVAALESGAGPVSVADELLRLELGLVAGSSQGGAR